MTIIDRNNHHLFQPLLYQVSMAELSTGDIAAPIRTFFRRYRNVDVLMAEVERIDTNASCVETSAGPLEYDYLVVASGSRHAYFGHEEWEAFAPGLKTLEQATEIRRRVLLAFERAEGCENESDRAEYLTFVLVGGGPTGVELAGAIAEMARLTLRKEFKKIDTRTARVILLEGVDRILAGFDSRLVARAERDLEALGVDVRTNSMVTEITERGVRAGERFIPSRTVLWAAGVTPSPLGQQLRGDTDRSGRVIVDGHLSVLGKPNVFVAGDLAYVEQDGRPLPGVAGVALQQGKYLGNALRKKVRGEEVEPFRYRDWGAMATVGHNRAIAQIGRLRLKGYPAWLAWVFVHIYYLSGFRNRVFVLLQWAWAYFTHRRSMRVIVRKQWRFYPEEK